MSGSVGLQGRYATSFGYGPRLGVGRYPNGERPANSLPSITARPSPGIVGFPSTEVTPFEMMQPAAADPVAMAAGGGDAGGMGMGDLLMGLAPAAALYGGRYLYKKLTEGDGAAAGGNVPYQPLAFDTAPNIAMAATGEGIAPGVSGISPSVMATMPGGNLFTAGATPSGGSLAAPVGLDNMSLGNIGDIASINTSDFGMAEGGLGGSWNPMDWSITTPGTGAFGLDVGVGPLTFNPVNMAAGAAGSYGGSRLAQHLAPYSGIGQTVGSSIGGIAGGALGGAVFGPIGALAGAFLGSLGGGTIGADSPNYPYSYFGGTIGNGTIDFWDPASRNGGDASAVRPLTNALRDYVTGRMAAEGMVVNPYRGGERAFSAGTTADPGGKFFVGAADINPAQAAYGMNTLGFSLLNAAHAAGLWPDQPSQTLGVWRGDNVADLPGQVWQQLVSNGSIGAPGSFQAPAPAAPAPPPEPMADPWANYGSGG